MNKGIYNICLLDVYQTFSEELEQKISKALQNEYNGWVIVELTGYADYCLRLLQNNGWNQEKDAKDILLFMWRACPALVFESNGYPDCRFQWSMENGSFYLKVCL